MGLDGEKVFLEDKSSEWFLGWLERCSVLGFPELELFLCGLLVVS